MNFPSTCWGMVARTKQFILRLFQAKCLATVASSLIAPGPAVLIMFSSDHVYSQHLTHLYYFSTSS